MLNNASNQQQSLPLSLSYIKTGNKYRKYLDTFLEHLITVAFILMFLVIMINIVSRYLPFVIVWAEIAAKISNYWVTFVGAAILVQTGGHIRVNYFDDPLHKKGLFHYYAMFISLLTLIVCLIIMYGSYQELLVVWPEYIPAWPGMRLYWFWLPTFIGMVLVNFYVILNIISIVKTYIKDKRHK